MSTILLMKLSIFQIDGAANGGDCHLGNRLQDSWSGFQSCFKTKTRDSAEHAWTYLRGLLEMKTGRNFANIAAGHRPGEDGQNLQQFMSDSPWEAQAVIQKVQQEIAITPGLQEGGCCFWMRVRTRKPPKECGG